VSAGKGSDPRRAPVDNPRGRSSAALGEHKPPILLSFRFMVVDDPIMRRLAHQPEASLPKPTLETNRGKVIARLEREGLGAAARLSGGSLRLRL
jgi:hypothetical protein